MHYFFCEQEKLIHGAVVSLPEAEGRHLFKTLRAGPGTGIGLLDGQGGRALGEVVDGRQVRISKVTRLPEPKLKLTLFVAPPRRQKMDQLLKQCAETGVWRIQPVITRRSVSQPEKKSALERWRTILREGCKQAVNPFVPLIELPVGLDEALEQFRREGMRGWFGSPAEGQKIDGAGREENEYAWFVGPEGGFTEEEELLMRESGLCPLKLGGAIMRVETAAICGIAVIAYELAKGG